MYTLYKALVKDNVKPLVISKLKSQKTDGKTNKEQMNLTVLTHHLISI